MKDAYYFPHDSNAIQDPKMMTLLTECGLAGIGAFWIIIELLHQQESGGIADPMLTQCLSFYGKQGSWDQGVLDKIRTVLLETKLLVLKNGVIYSNRVINNLKRRAELSNKGKENALKRWQPNAKPMQPHCDPNAIKESKGKEKKEETTTTKTGRFEKPTAVEVSEYAKSLSFELNGRAFVDHYEAKGWVIGKSPMKDWKAAVRTWKTRQSTDPKGVNHAKRSDSLDKLMARENAESLKRERVGGLPDM